MRLLSDEDCATALTLMRSCRKEVAQTTDGVSYTRVGTVAWLDRNATSEWLYSRIESFGLDYGKQLGIDIDAIEVPIQFALYRCGSVFDWHLDTGEEATKFRKVTVSVQLTSGNDYDGGDLQFVSEVPCILNRARGSAIAFGSLLGHRVTKVTRGTRCALVAWFRGPPWR